MGKRKVVRKPPAPPPPPARTPPARTRAEIGAMLGEELGLSSKQGSKIVDFVLNQIRRDLAEGRDVKLSRFGTFKSVFLKAGTMRNPFTDGTVECAARRTVRFKPSRQLKGPERVAVGAVACPAG